MNNFPFFLFVNGGSNFLITFRLMVDWKFSYKQRIVNFLSLHKQIGTIWSPIYHKILDPFEPACPRVRSKETINEEKSYLHIYRTRTYSRKRERTVARITSMHIKPWNQTWSFIIIIKDIRQWVNLHIFIAAVKM